MSTAGVAMAPDAGTVPIVAPAKMGLSPSASPSDADRSPLGDLGVDVSLLDDVKPGPLTSRSRESFYQILAAVGRAEPGELLATAEADLGRSGRDRFSVVPLFNDPESMRGRLVVLSGTAREVLLVHVPDRDIRDRFGIDHYYQVSLFTEDSQDNPLVFCVRDIPPGMPTGAGPGYAEDVTVAGFYFKPWAYRSRAAVEDEPAEGASKIGVSIRLAPLLIGREVQWHPSEVRGNNSMAAAAAAGALLLLVAVVWLVLWLASRGDERFRRETLARHLDGEPEGSLDEIEIETREES